MALRLTEALGKRISAWLIRDHGPGYTTMLCDFERLRFEIRPGDVLLLEGRSRISEVIKLITQSPWTHSALYIGRIHDIADPAVRERVLRFYHGDPNGQLIIEALLGEGTVVNPIAKYRSEHLRICRPGSLSPADAQKVITRATDKLGCDYDVRQLLDLARFLFPYNFLPRRWRSSLFEHNAGGPTRTVCASMLAEAFGAVQFPIMPIVKRLPGGGVRLYRRNSRLFTPRDFDYSPYFEIIKYPYLGINELASYRELPWDEAGRVCNAENDCYLPKSVRQTNDGMDKAPAAPFAPIAAETEGARAPPESHAKASVPDAGAGGGARLGWGLNALLHPMSHPAFPTRKKPEE